MPHYLKHVLFRSFHLHKGVKFSRLLSCYCQEPLFVNKQADVVYTDISLKDTVSKLKKRYAKDVRVVQKHQNTYSKDITQSVPNGTSLLLSRKIHNCTYDQKNKFSSDNSTDQELHLENKRNEKHVKEKDKISRRENIFTIPNIITTCRIIVTPYLGYLVLQGSFELACGIFVVTGLSDLADGWIARNFKNQTSAFGSFLDPLADKLLISMLFVTLTVSNVLPVPLTVLVISRDIALIIAAFYIRYMSLPSPHTFTQFFDATNPSAQLKPLFISKVNTAFQLILIAFSLASPVFGYVDHAFLHFLWYATAGTTICSGLSYIMHVKDTFKISDKIKRK